MSSSTVATLILAVRFAFSRAYGGTEERREGGKEGGKGREGGREGGRKGGRRYTYEGEEVDTANLYAAAFHKYQTGTHRTLLQNTAGSVSMQADTKVVTCTSTGSRSVRLTFLSATISTFSPVTRTYKEMQVVIVHVCVCVCVCVYLIARKAVQPRVLLNIARLDVEARSMPWAPHSSIAKVTLGQRAPIVRTLVSDGGEFSILPHQQSLGVPKVYLSQPVS